jgi:hypothetical protein
MFCEYIPSELLNKVDGGEVVGSMEKGSSGMGHPTSHT